MPKRKKLKPLKGAPYVETDRNQLGDSHLDEGESLIRERQKSLDLAAKSKIWGQRELEDKERSAGARLSYREVIRRLQNINTQIQVREGSPGSVAMYRRKKPWEYEESDPQDGFFQDHVYVTGCEKHDLPEYPHVTLDTSGLPVREYRGWRSLLIAFIKSGAITYEQSIQAFGNPRGDPRSTRWFEQLGQFIKT